MLETLEEGLTVVDERGAVVLRNRSAERILRLAAGPIELGDSFPPGTVVDAQGAVLPIESWPLSIALRTGQPARDVLLGLSRPGEAERIWLSVNAEPLLLSEGEAQVGAVATFHEVTERLRQDALLAEYAARLQAYES